MTEHKAINLGSSLKQRVEVLALKRDEDGNYAWTPIGTRYAAVEMDTRKNIFSDVGIGARGVTVTLRPDRMLTLHHALRWQGQHLFMTSIIPAESRDRLEVKAAVCQPVIFTAEPQSRKGRDALNRPTVEKVPAYTFPGVLTELYHREMEDEEVPDTDIVRRVVVTAKEIALRKGDVIRHPDGTAYPIQRVLDLDEFKNEYVIWFRDEG